MKNKNIEKYFDDVSQDYLSYKYLTSERSFYSVRQKKIVELISTLDKSQYNKVLDAGCGPGIILKDILEQKYIGYGIDISQNMLKLAKNYLSKYEHFLLSNTDIERLPFKDNAFDIIYSAGVIEYLNSDVKVLSEFKRLLRNNGVLIIPVTNRYSYNLIFDDIINYIRNNKLIFSFFNFVNINILKRGIIKQKKFNIRKHSPKEFQQTLKKLDYEILDSLYFYFSPIPYPFNLFMKKLWDKIGMKMDKLGKNRLGFLGEGYLVVCKNIK
jgi:ubiquinone/menaquinone biosynthesis C-methylase UbiE